MEEWKTWPSPNWSQTASTSTCTKITKEEKEKTSKPIHSVSAAQVWHIMWKWPFNREKDNNKKKHSLAPLYRWPQLLNTGQFYSNLRKLFLGPLDRGWSIQVWLYRSDASKLFENLNWKNLSRGPYGSIWCQSIRCWQEQIN